MYALTVKKGSIILELSTTDKDTVAKQLELFILAASDKNRKESVQEQTETKMTEETVEAQTNTDIAKENIENQDNPNNLNIDESNQEIIPQTLNVGEARPVTINSLQNPEPEEIKKPDFEKILTREIEQQSNINPVLKDEKFIEYVQSKSATDKLDFLITAAQYLTKYEGLNTFSLKHINSKLMQNFTLIVDHNVLQSAIDKECVAKIQDGADDSTTEYMLTEKGLRSY